MSQPSQTGELNENLDINVPQILQLHGSCMDVENCNESNSKRG